MSAGPPALPLPPSPRMGSDWDLPSALSPPPPSGGAGRQRSYLLCLGGRHPQESVTGTDPVLSSMGWDGPMARKGTVSQGGLMEVCAGRLSWRA